MATTDCVIPLSSISAEGGTALCGVVTSSSEIVLTPVLTEEAGGVLGVAPPGVRALFSHLKPEKRGEESPVKYVQLLLNNNTTQGPKIRVIAEAASKVPPLPPPPAADPSLIDESCTICGQHYVDRSAFNAHIKLHLKEKLNIRRNKRKLREKEEEEEEEQNRSKKPSLEPPRRKAPKAEPPRLVKKTDVMAELAACQPVPPEAVADLSIPPNPLVFPPTPASSVCSAMSPAKSTLAVSSSPSLELSTPDISDMEDDLMSYEMEMNRMDFNVDISTILDQIEKDFESPGFLDVTKLDTPPDSDAENNSFERKEDPKSEEEDKVDLDKLVNDTILSSSPSLQETQREETTIMQSPASIAKVGQLSPKALAVLNQLPSKLFSAGNGSRVVNVVKIERSGGSEDLSNTVINIQCQSSHNNKIIESYRAIDTGKELKLIPTLGSPAPKPVAPSKTVSSECSVCGKTITTKNMARHMEKHTGKKKFHCEVCQASFYQKTHLKNHISLHKIVEEERSPPFSCWVCQRGFVQKGHLNRHLKSSHGSLQEESLDCKICKKRCKNKVSLVRHRTKHLVCSHCSKDDSRPVKVFNSKITLQEHMMKVHPDSAILSVENYFGNSSSDDDVFGDNDDFLDYSSTSIKDEKLPNDSLILSVSSSSSSSTSSHHEEEEEERPSGNSIAEISNSDFFNFDKEIKEYYLTDLFC